MVIKSLKKFQAIFLAVVMLAGLVPVLRISQVSAADDKKVIYSNDFQSQADAVQIGSGTNKALEFDATGDINNSWVSIFQKDFNFEYADKVSSGAALSFDLLLPKGSTYKGTLKAQAVTKMGNAWAWTQSNTIPELTIDKFADSGEGYLKANVSIPFGDEIEKVQGIKAIVPCLAASNCDYKGKIYLDNVKLFDGVAKQSAISTVPKVDPITFKFDSDKDVTGWADGGKWDYDGGMTVGFDNAATEGALKLDVDYSKNASTGWSEAKVMYKFAQAKQLEGYNRFSFDFIYDPAKMTKGVFKAKLNAGIIDTNTDVKDAVDFGKGLKKATVSLEFASAANSVENFTIGIVGSNTDYKGSIYIDNVTFSQVVVADGYVDVTKKATAQTPISIKTNSIVANGKTQSVSKNVTMVDDKATANTAKLYAYLQAVGKTDSVLYGHQNDIHHKAGNKALSNSDTKDVTGSISAVVGIDALSLTGNELSTAPWDAPLADRVAACEKVTKEAADQGAIITLSAHMPNFEIIDKRVQNSKEGTAKDGDQNSVGILSDGSYNFSGYTPGTLTGNIVSRIMPGQDLNYLYTGYLDMIAAYAQALDKDGISVMFRPFHENTGSWFWWGAAFCDTEAYKNLYKYTVEYLRDVKGVHNFLYVYGPSSDAESTTDYAKRYPGDDYVDMVGFDMYHQSPAAGDNFISQFKKELSIVQTFAAKHNKLFAVTETGVANPNNQALLKSGNQRKDWYREILDAVASSNASYFLLWANFGTDSGFYTPYVVSKTDTTMRGHEMLDNFIDFYNDSRSVFASQVGDYKQISVQVNPNKGVSGYITDPVSGSRILEETTITASIRNTKDTSKVKFVAKNKKGDVTIQLPASKDWDDSYAATLSEEQLKKLGASTGTIALVVDGKTYNVINAKFNMPEVVADPTVVDNFESYYGDNAVMGTSWSTGKGTGCTITPSLSNKCSEGDYGLEFKYSLVDGGYVGVVKNLDGVDWSGKNALQLWTIPDGKKQKVVVQITSGKNVFEVYLNQYKEYNEANGPVLVTIPFSSFVGRDDKKAVFDPKSIQSFGLWCNAIVPDGEKAASYKLDSALYYDDIKAVSSDVKDITFTKSATK